MAEERLQRRLAAILSADVVGYSRLMGIDEAGTLARLKALRRNLIDPTIAAHSGRIVKLMGDGALVEFASAVDAVTCAMEIQRQLWEQHAVWLRSRSDPVPDRDQCRRHYHRW
jgi:adenylate cyclase